MTRSSTTRSAGHSSRIFRASWPSRAPRELVRLPKEAANQIDHLSGSSSTTRIRVRCISYPRGRVNWVAPRAVNRQNTAASTMIPHRHRPGPKRPSRDNPVAGAPTLAKQSSKTVPRGVGDKEFGRPTGLLVKSPGQQHSLLSRAATFRLPFGAGATASSTRFSSKVQKIPKRSSRGSPRRRAGNRSNLRRSPSGFEHSLSLGTLNLGAQLLALAHEALMALEFADDAMLGNTGTKSLQERIEGFARSQAYLHLVESPPFCRRPLCVWTETYAIRRAIGHGLANHLDSRVLAGHCQSRSGPGAAPFHLLAANRVVARFDRIFLFRYTLVACVFAGVAELGRRASLRGCWEPTPVEVRVLSPAPRNHAEVVQW